MVTANISGQSQIASAWDALMRLDKLRGPDRNGWYTARCPVPSHRDRNPSLSFRRFDDNGIYIRCWGNCPTKEVVQALGCSMSDLCAPTSSKLSSERPFRIVTDTTDSGSGCTLAAYARMKQLPVDFLASLGLSDVPPPGGYNAAISIPYYDASRRIVVSTQLRIALEKSAAGERFKWRYGSRAVPYGQWKLTEARERGYITLVEGASDCHTLWFHHEPALGFPGAKNWQDERDAPLLNGIPTIYIVVEPDSGGEGVKAWLATSRLRDRVKIVAMPHETKDPSALYLSDPLRFTEKWAAMLQAAQPWAEFAPPQANVGGKTDATDDALDHEARHVAISSLIGESKFPLNVLPEKMRALAQAASRAIPCPPEFVASSALVAAAVSIGATWRIQVKRNQTSPAIFWLTLIGAPGDGKTPALEEYAFAPLNKRQIIAAARFQAEFTTWQTQDPKDRGVEPEMEEFLATDTTIEALGDILQKTVRGVGVYRDELHGWVAAMDAYKAAGKGSERDHWLTLWSGGLIKVNRRNRRHPLVIPRPVVSVAGGIQEDRLASLDDERGQSDGFIHRLLFVYPPIGPVVDSRAGVADEVLDGWDELIGRLLKLDFAEPVTLFDPPKPNIATFADDAFASYWEGRDKLTAEINDPAFPQQLRGPWIKLREYAGRFALILHLCRVLESGATDELGKVSACDVEGAWALVAYFKTQARKAYARLHASPDNLAVAKILDWVKRKGGVVTVRDLMLARISKEASESAEIARGQLEDLAKRGFGKMEERHPERGGRSTYTFTVFS